MRRAGRTCCATLGQPRLAATFTARTIAALSKWKRISTSKSPCNLLSVRQGHIVATFWSFRHTTLSHRAPEMVNLYGYMNITTKADIWVSRSLVIVVNASSLLASCLSACLSGSGRDVVPALLPLASIWREHTGHPICKPYHSREFPILQNSPLSDQ